MNLLQQCLNGTAKLKPIEWGVPFGEIDHEKLADRIGVEKDNVETVLIRTELLSPKLWDDPKHCHHEHILCASRIMQRAAKRTENYPRDEQYDALCKREKYPAGANNFEPADSDANRKFRSRLMDGVYEACALANLPSIAKEAYDECAYKLNPDDYYPVENKLGNPIKVGQKTQGAQFIKYWEWLCLPEVITRFDRQYLMPKPFDHWDSRNRDQQFFLVEKDTHIEYIWGGYGSSSTRENKGRWAHVFAYLEKHYGYKIPTHIFKYTAKNEFKHVKTIRGFRATPLELHGNYHVDFSQTSHLFKGKLYSFKY